jgi:hypothetical protein
MRRAYNGYMYSQGRTTGTTLEKIHPGDIVRTEFDGKAGTLSYSINGGDLEVGFTDINETIFPTCGSYRNGVVVRLLKVEVYQNFDDDVDNIATRSSEIVHWNLDKESTRDLTILTLNKQLKDNDNDKWITSRGDKGVSKGVHDWSFELLEKCRIPFAIGIIAGCDPYTKDGLAGACYEKIAKDKIKENTLLDISTSDISRQGATSLDPTSVPLLDRGARLASRLTSLRHSSGILERSDSIDREILQDTRFVRHPQGFGLSASSNSNATLFFGRDSSEDIDVRRRLLGRRSRTSIGISDDEDDDNISHLVIPDEPLSSPSVFVRSNALSRTSILIDTLDEDPSNTLSSSPISNHPLLSTMEASEIIENADDNIKEKIKTDINIQKKNIIRKSNYSYDGITAMAWYSDGSLWYNGSKVYDGFGKNFLPLEFMSAVTIRVDREECTLSYYVNGVFVGTAFGPSDSDAVVKIPLPILTDCIVYPAGSVSSSLSKSVKETPKSQSLRIKPTGFYGSTVIPLRLSLQKSCASIIGRMVSILLTGTKCDVNEELLMPWLQSPLLIGGIDNNEKEMNKKDEKENLLNNNELSWDICWSKIRNNSKDNTNKSNLETNIPFSSGRDSFEESAHLSQNIFLNKLKSTTMNDKNQIELSKEGKVLLEWLENDVSKIAGVYENNMMKTVYKRIGNYSVPSCEMPSLACLLKHGGLINEAIQVIEKIETKQKPNYPSDDMIALWKRIHQLRCLLRKMRQSYKELSISENIPLDLETDNTVNNENKENIDVNDKFISTSSSSDITIETELSQTSLSLQSTISYPILPSSTSILHSTPPIFENINDSLLELISYSDCALLLNDEIAWKIQTPPAISSYTFDYECAVLSFGIDFENEIGYIRFHVYGNGSLGDLDVPTDAILHVDDFDITDSDPCYVDREGVDSANDFIGCLRFDLSSCSNFDSISSLLIQFTYGHDYDPVTLQTPTIADVPAPRLSEISPSLILDVGSNLSVENDISTPINDDNKDQKEGLDLNKDLNTPKSFDEFCSIIESKSLFLLSIVPSGCDISDVGANNGSKSKSLLLDLLDRYTTDGTPINENKIHRTNSYEGDRWGKVIDFLKVRSKLNRQVSNDKLSDKRSNSSGKKGDFLRRISEMSVYDQFNLINDDQLSLMNDRENEDFEDIGLNIDINTKTSSSILQTNIVQDDADTDDDNDLIENITPVQAAIQAISLFITSDNLDVSPKKLYDVMKLRTKRSEYRLFALESINEILNINDITSDPMAIEEILLFIKPSLKSSVEKNKVIDKNNNSYNSQPCRSHYLSNLEGCQIERLYLVQEKFLSVYTKLSILISNYVSTWNALSMSHCNININNSSINLFPVNEKDNLITNINSCHSHILLSPLKLFLSLWSLNFSSRDYLFLIKSGVLQSLQQLTSFTNYEKAVNVWYHNGSLLANINKNIEEETRNRLNLSKKKWSIWPQSFVQNGLKSGLLSCRALLLHLYLAPLSLLSSEERNLLGLNFDYDILCLKYGISEVSYLYHQIFSLIKHKKNKLEKDELLKKELIEAEINKKLLEKSSIIADCGCFDKTHKATDVILSESGLSAAIHDGIVLFRLI